MKTINLQKMQSSADDACHELFILLIAV